MTERLIPTFFGAALTLLPLACSSTDTTGTTTTNTTPDAGNPTEDAGPGDSSILAGSFQVRLVAPIPAMNGAPASDGYTAVLGILYDGPSPAPIIWVPGNKVGDCQLSTPKVPFCNTPCGGTAVCVDDDKCQPYPTPHSAGTVTVTGIHTDMGDGFAMTPIADNYQAPASAKLLYPGFSEGEVITFAASGDFFSAFSVASKGVTQLEILNKDIPLESGKPVALSWTPPKQADISKIHVKVDISHHGGTKGLIECDAADNGSLTIDASLITELVNLGVAGFPQVIVTRSAVGSTTIAQGRVDLVVSSTIERSVTIPGVESCTGTADCTPPKTCQDDLTCK